MGKVFKAVVIGAIVAVIAVYAYPLLGFSSTPFFRLFGIKNALLAAAIGGGITGGLSALLAPSLDLSTVQARIRVSVDPQAGMKWVFGTTALSTDLVWAGRHGANNEFYTYVVAGAGHLIESYQNLYINDELIAFAGGDPNATGAWANGLWRQTNLGTESQTSFADIDGDDNFANTLWPATADGLGMAHYRLRFRIDHEKVEGGIPTRITQVAQGGPVYDPRLDTTRGGTGAHRTDDQSTWEWENGGTVLGDNWALVVLRYLLGWKINGILVIGVGIDGDDIDMDQAMAAANVCEAVVDGIPRYRVGGLLPVTNDHEAIIKQLEGAINGKVAIVGGMYYIWAPNDDLTTFSDILEGDLIRAVGVDFTPSGDLRLLYNTARGRYVDPGPESLFQPRPYPEVEESTAITEDGGVRLKEHDFSLIQDESIAERVARQIVRRSRFGATWRFAMGPKGLTFQPFDVTILNCQETNNVNVTVRIINMSFSVSGAVVMEVIEEDSSIYDTTAPLGTSVLVNDPGGFDSTAAIALTGMLSTDITLRGDSGTATDGFEVTWDDPGPFVVTTEVQYKIAAEAEFIQVPVARIDLTKAIIWPVEPNTLHDIRARHITRAGVVGTFVSLQDTSSDNTTARPTNVGGALNLTYDDLDTTQLAAGQSRYAMLTDRTVNTTGSQNNFHLTDAILLNKEDFNGTNFSLFLSTIQLGDRITYEISSNRWFVFEIDETFQSVGAGDAEAYKFGVILIDSVDSNPTVNIPTAAGTSVGFQFNQNPLVEGNLLFDPDFDFSTSLPVVTDETSVGFWDNTSHWVGLKKMTAPSSSPSFANWGWTFNAGTGPNNSNTITLITAIPITSGFTEGWLVARRRIRTNTPSFDVKIRIRATQLNDDVDLQIQVRGYDLPTGGTVQATVAKGFKSLYTDGSTWVDLEFHLEAGSDVDAQYWEIRLGFNHIVVVDIGIVDIDSIFVYPTPRSFGANTFQDEGTGNAKYHSGLVPESDVTTDANKVLQADGTWVAQTGGGGATELSDLTDVNTSTPTIRNVLVADGVDFESRRLVAADVDFATTDVFLGRDTAGAGDGEEITAAAARTILNVEDGATADQTAGEIEAIVNHDNLLGFLDAEHVDWAVTGAEDVHANRLSSGVNMADSLLDRPYISDFAIEHQIVSGVSSTTINYVSGQSVLLNMTANITTLTLSNWPATGRLGQLQIEIAQDVTPRTIAWPAAITWVNDTPPDLSIANEIYIVNLSTRDGGTTIIGSYPFDSALAVTSVFGRTGNVVAIQADYDTFFLTQTEADALYAILAHVHDAADITTGTFADALIAVTNVTQHEGAIDHDALSNFLAAEHVDWAITGAEDIHANRLSSGANMADSLLDRPHISDFAVEHQVVAGVASTTIDYTAGQSVLLELNASNITTLTLNNWPVTGRLGQLELEITQQATPRTIAWPAAVDWLNGAPPDLSTANETYIVNLTTRDAGTNIIGSYPFDSAGGVTSIFGRTGAVVALLTDYDGFFLTPAEGDAAYSLLSHIHAAADITTGIFAVARIPDLDAAKIVSGAFATARIPSLATSKITSGTFVAARIPTHTGHVTGQTSLSLVVAAITGQSALTSGLAGTDELLLSDAGVIKRMDISVMNAYFNSNLSFAAVSHNHNASDINAGTLPVGRGGTGVTSSTGTGNTVRSANPTFTGTVVTAAINMADNKLDRPHIDDFAILHQVVTGVASTTISHSAGQSVLLNLSAANITTLTLSNWPASGRLGQLELEITQGATPRTIAWPAAVEWPGGTAPDLNTANGRFLVHLRTRNAGTNIIGTFTEALS